VSDQPNPQPEAPGPRPGRRRLDSIWETLDVGRRAHDRRERIVAEIQANRRGEYRVPTWVLTLVLVLVIAAIVTFLAVL
jgi:hypothetical protein